MGHFPCNVISNSIACGRLAVQCGWFCKSCVHSTFLPQQCLLPACPCGLVYLYARQLRGYRGFPSAVQTPSAVSWGGGMSPSLRVWVVGSWAPPLGDPVLCTPLEELLPLMILQTMAIYIRKKKHICLFVFQPPCRMVLLSFYKILLLKKIDKKSSHLSKFSQMVFSISLRPTRYLPCLTQILPFLAKKSQVWDFFRPTMSAKTQALFSNFSI